MSLNFTIFDWLYQWVVMYPQIKPYVVFIADRLDWLVIIFAVIVVLVLYDPRPNDPYISWSEIRARLSALFSLLSAGVLAWVIAVAIKQWIVSPRPWAIISGVQPLLDISIYDTFPSGHAAVFFAAAFALWWYRHWVGILFFAFAMIIGIARIMAGVHFPGDILAGACIGGLSAFVIHEIGMWIIRVTRSPSWISSSR